MNRSKILKFYVFLVGFGWALEVGLIGRFSLSEVLMYLALPILFFTNSNFVWNSTAVKSALLLGVFCSAVIVSDLVNTNYLAFFMRGFARPIALGLNSLFFALILARSQRLLIPFFVGMLPGACVGYFQSSDFVEYGLRGGYVYFSAKVQPILFALSILLGIFAYRINRLLSVFIFLAAAIVVAVYGSRSGSFAYFMTSFTLLYTWIVKGQKRSKLELSFSFMLKTASVIIIAFSCVYWAYLYAAPRGYMGVLQQSKFYDQSETRFGVTPLGLVAAGRTEVVAGVLAGLDNPIWGLGSWPTIGDYVIEAMDIAGEPVSDEMYMSVFQRAGGHSIIVGTWFNNGLFAVLYWLFLVFLMLRVLLLFIRRDNILTPAVILIFYELSWALLFSPLNLKGRLWVGIFTGLAICLTDKRGPLVPESDFAMLSPFSKLYKRRTFWR
ncbi:hypothetical protein QEH59_14250 [Coraliomargarita sp. SDUM461004]|uniref:O-antigen polysaccharide polymerase Wzy n=1 Tax=Thalassobacterium sedimentorum TaxID=3041258 RepID=A0ABU1APB4_9BACT|nr:hypothetical protein [Coraliomargarita sp. SDUM461004]MDQ8195591.1 hypothetical protein [Coraliomargarita sp. SDUM461004]